MRLRLPQVETCVRQRVPVYELFGGQHDLSALYNTESQQAVVAILKAITNLYYVQSFLKRYIALLEKNQQELDEDLYTYYCSPAIISARSKPSDVDVLTYRVGGDLVTIQETPSIISGNGTTGARTWEAALFLSHVLQKYPLSGTICELGAGTGLVGISLLKTTDSRVVLTDGEASLLAPMETNLNLSGIRDNFETKQLVWGVDAAFECDYVVAADVLYDNSIIDDLASTIGDFFRLNCKECLVSATVRNPATLKQWEDTIDAEFDWDFLERCEDPSALDESHLWFRAGTQPIQIYRLKGLKEKS